MLRRRIWNSIQAKLISSEREKSTAALRRSFATSPDIEKQLDLYSKKKQTSVSLKTLMDSGRGLNLDGHTFGTMGNNKASEKILMQIACFLHREMPVRLAHRAMKLESSPLFLKSGEFTLILTRKIIYSILTVCVLITCRKYPECVQLVQNFF